MAIHFDNNIFYKNAGKWNGGGLSAGDVSSALPGAKIAVVA
jgi:hypothetical protein